MGGEVIGDSAQFLVTVTGPDQHAQNELLAVDRLADHGPLQRELGVLVIVQIGHARQHRVVAVG